MDHPIAYRVAHSLVEVLAVPSPDLTVLRVLDRKCAQMTIPDCTGQSLVRGQVSSTRHRPPRWLEECEVWHHQVGWTLVEHELAIWALVNFDAMRAVGAIEPSVVPSVLILHQKENLL